MSHFTKCDLCEAYVEEGHGYICKCTFTDEVCVRCAGAGINQCGVCNAYYEPANFRKSTKK